MTADGAELPLLIAWLLTERLPKPAWLLPPSDLLVREACGRASPGCGGTLAGEAGPVAVAGLGDQVPAPWSLPRGAAVASFPEDKKGLWGLGPAASHLSGPADKALTQSHAVL